MNASLGLHVLFGIGYVALSILWPRVYFRRFDPALRGRLSRRLGVPVVWVRRTGGLHRGPLWFGPKYATWCWTVGGDGEITSGKDAVAYASWLLVVPVLAGLSPIAVFLIVLFGLGFPSVWVAYPLLFLIVPIYTRYWSGKYEVPGMRPPRAAGTEPSSTEHA